jgi:hypothetical protein
MHEAKQMTTGQPVGAASHTIGGFSAVARIGSKSVSSMSDSIRFESGCVLVFHGGVFWVLEPDEWETFKSGS